MSREAWVAGLFFPLALLALWSAATPLMTAAAVMGLVFLYCQGMILREAKGIPAWRERRIVPLIVATGLTEGSGLFLVAGAFLPALSPHLGPVAAAMAVLIAVRAQLWRAYLAALQETGAPVRALETLSGLRPWLLAVGVIVPLLLTVAGFVVPRMETVLFALGGLAAMAAGWLLKFALVTRAGHNQGFALKHVPIRGAGVAGPAVKPGWSLP
jgi:phenylacetyl-CoA:acceptor oxidoreductase subunit 2